MVKRRGISKNGSYEKLDLMESFVLGDDGKVESFKQWKAIDSVNFGMSYGGKFLGKNKIQILEDLLSFQIEMKQK